MNATFVCPQCNERVRTEITLALGDLACPQCAAKWPVSASAIADGKLWQCLVCPSDELFVRKDFSQSLGIGIVVAGIVVSSIFWAYRMPFWAYAVLFTTALLDVVVYFAVGNLLECYRCQAQYRGVPGLENHGGFDLETHEKHRQQRIRLAQQVRH
jgi:hypothetical protein